jgi:hypothetical protein
LAVAPVGSVLLAVVVGADFEAVEVFAAAAVVAAGAAAAGAAAAGAAGAAAVFAAAGAAVVEAAAGLLFDAFCTPPCPLQAPRPVAVEVVPSLQVLGVPEDAGAAAGAAGADAAGAAGVGAVSAAFWTPPWPLQAPRPVAVEVVPSLQVVGAEVESAAQAGSDNANTIKGAAMSPMRFGFFMKVHSLVYVGSSADCSPVNVWRRWAISCSHS